MRGIFFRFGPVWAHLKLIRWMFTWIFIDMSPMVSLMGQLDPYNPSFLDCCDTKQKIK